MNVTGNGIPTLHIYQSVIHSLLILIGWPLNLFIIYIIVSHRKLHKPRPILFLGSCLANFFTLMTILAELVAHHAASTTMCVIFVAVTGIAYTSLLANMLLSLVDRYVSISFPLWYHNNITVHRVIATQIGIFVVVSAMIKSTFLAGYDRLGCRVFDNQSKILMVSNLTLVACCIILQIIVYTTVLNYLKKMPSSSVQVESTNSSRDMRERLTMALRVHVETTTVRQLELDATRNLLIGIMSLLIFTSPMLLTGLVAWVCRSIYYQTCINVDAAVVFSHEILLFHVVINPIIYMIRCRELSLTVRQKFARPQRCSI